MIFVQTLRMSLLLFGSSIWLFSITANIPASQSVDSVCIKVSPEHTAAIPLLIIGVGTEAALYEIIQIVGKDLAFSGQFTPEVRMIDQIHVKNVMKMAVDRGYALVIFLSKSENSFEWRLYDVITESMVKGRQYQARGTVLRGWAHNISDLIWPELTGKQASFSSKLAYCKEVLIPGKKRCTHVVVADYDGSNEQTVVVTPTLHVAPRWNGDKNNPLLFYSEGTHANIRLMCLSMQGKRKIASNFDGLNMLPTFSGDGTKAVYCASKGHGNCQLYLFEKGSFRRLTHNEGNNVSPSLSKDGNILFYCSDVPTGKPQIYRYDLTTKMCKQITKGGFNFCPNYHQESGKLAYSSIVDGEAQIFVYDQVTDTHTKMTVDTGNKDECFWSPCGSYLIFCVEQGLSSRLAVLNIYTNELKYITASTDRCSYPCWSPCYTTFPVYACEKSTQRP